MVEPRKGHILGMSGQNLVVCGGDIPSETATKQCEEYDKEQEKWIQVAQTLEETKFFFHPVQLDNHRIWMGRKCGSFTPVVLTKYFLLLRDATFHVKHTHTPTNLLTNRKGISSTLIALSACSSSLG